MKKEQLAELERRNIKEATEGIAEQIGGTFNGSKEQNQADIIGKHVEKFARGKSRWFAVEKPEVKYDKITPWYIFYHAFVNLAMIAIMIVGMFDVFFYIAINAVIH